MPDQPQRPARQPSKPDIQELDRVFGGAPAQSRLDRPPTRKGTLPGIPVQAVLPSPPRSPVEFAPTMPAPRNPLQHQTVQRPAPPSAVANARRTDPPAGPAATPTSIRVPASAAAPGGPLGPTLPPPSATAEEASAAAQRRDLERLQAERDQARAQVQLERLRAEEQAAAHAQLQLDAAAKLATLQLEIERERTKQANAPAKPWIDERLVKALVALLTALAGLGVPLGIWLTAKATAQEHTQAREGERTKDATATAASAKVESSGTNKELDELKQQLAAERSYNREVLRRMGVQIPKRTGDPDPPELKTDTPLPKPGKVSSAPVLVVTTPPP